MTDHIIEYIITIVTQLVILATCREQLGYAYSYGFEPICGLADKRYSYRVQPKFVHGS